AGFVEEQVGRLDVPVHDAEGMGVFQGVGRLGDQFGDMAVVSLVLAGALRAQGGDGRGISGPNGKVGIRGRLVLRYLWVFGARWTTGVLWAIGAVRPAAAG